jgi:GH15 family glucan-1,4-alpha-glucosidase
MPACGRYRGEPAHYVHSKLMAWLALDRTLGIANSHKVSAKRRVRWSQERDAIRADIIANGVDAGRGIFVRAYGRTDLDAALLILPLIGLERPDSPRTIATIAAIRRQLAAGGPLLYRYPPGEDGLAGREGAFLPCSFWLAQALAATGAVDDATALLENLTNFGGPLGLYSEEVDPSHRGDSVPVVRAGTVAPRPGGQPNGCSQLRPPAASSADPVQPPA